ncbi:FAD-dependent oxidoreductase [Pontivivens insulae]|uniref:3-hydroxybenzoate 6-hydroxylase 1 n=1 Tax=Pontivivens insulae TaxID=1639689 RepID=A0A2R8ACW1_9RHOB|nr:FAD-dependent oxidoreductase [Pontivivens insulae]RED13841.1 salicylate hydroxylase [Pontivivens insulae]SPF29915.1 3-hydroxybenzoate 6-hydroxylase 1 [Pontivivens insulae]
MRVAIVGAGIAGLSAALACAQRGLTVTIFEQAAALGEVGAGLQLGPNAVAVLDALGLGEEARALATRPDAVVIRDHWTGARLMQVAMGDAAEARWKRPLLAFHRADLIGLLANAVEAEGVTFRLGTAVAPEGAVDGDVGGDRFDVVIGADGVKSGLRAALGEMPKADFTGFAAWRALTPRAPDAPNRTELTIGPDRHIVTYPLRGGRLTNIVAVTKRIDWRAEGWSEVDDPDNLRRAFDGWSHHAQDALADVRDTFLWGLLSHPELPHWHKGKLVVIGDAAHPMLPFLAQGAAMGLEDGWALAHCLSQGADLARFEAHRKARATRMQAAAVTQGRINHTGLPLRPALLAGMAVTDRLFPRFGQRRMDWIYGHDPVAEAAIAFGSNKID